MTTFINNTLHQLPGTYMQNCTNHSEGFMYCMASYVKDISQGSFWALMLLGFGIVMFMAVYIKEGTRKAFGFTSFIWIMGGIFLSTMNLINIYIASAFIVAGLGGLLALVYR